MFWHRRRPIADLLALDTPQKNGVALNAFEVAPRLQI